MAIVTITKMPQRARISLARNSPATLVSSHRSQHVRTLHFGPWCSHLDPNHRRDTRRRHRVVRYRYMDTISRKLSWDNGSRSHDAKLAMKRAMAAHLMSEKHPSETKYIDADKVQSWSDDISGLRPGRNIEDAERDAIDHLFRSSGRASYEHDLWMSPLRNIQNYLSSKHAPKDVSPEDVISATTNGLDADADGAPSPRTSPKHKGPRSPASRRRNHRKGASLDSANVIHAQAPSSSFTPKYEDLDSVAPQATTNTVEAEKYGPELWNEPDGLPLPTAEEESKSYKDLDSYKATKWNEPDGLPQKSPEEQSKNYSDLDKYKPVSWNEPDGLQPKTSEELSKNYDDLKQYKAVQWNEPEGLPPKSSEELSKNYDDLDQYNAVRWNEPDGLPELTAEELSKRYDDLGKYKPVEWNEPNGLRVLTPEEKSKEYEDLDVYSEPFTASTDAVEAHAASQLDTTAKAEPLASKIEVHSELPQYEDLHKYGPVHWNEPDGLREATPEEKSKNYSDLHLYGAVQWNEPDGLPKPTAEEMSKNYEDLPAYTETGFEAEVVPTRIHPEEASKQYSDLSKYESFDNDGAARVHPEEASKAYEDLDLYRSPKLDSFETQYPTHPEEATKAYSDLDAYQPVYHSEPNGSYAAATAPANDGLDTFDEQMKARRQEYRHFTSSSEMEDSTEAMTAKDIRARMAQDPADQDHQRTMDEEKSRYDSEWDFTAGEAQDAVRLSKRDNEPRFTGNYVRDFPEDFKRTWSAKSSSSSLLPDDVQPAENDASASAKEDYELSSMDESFPIHEPRMEPALDRSTPSRYMSNRVSREQAADPYSKVPQGLETSFAEEMAGQTTWPTLVKHYEGANPSNEKDSAGASAGQSSYKVLAYDRTTQSVSVAEMTSSVLDEQPAASLSEVMLKLSNPARFLPHFGPLHSQGYEVASGSGDVLIFRKVRAASADPLPDHTSHGPVNPIDLMGKPVMGNFASPTGFVNYESLAGNDTLKPEPPFRSNIDVRKEEPVFSGARLDETSGSKKNKKKKSMGRRVAVGGALTVGVAYAVGVMAEYFSTGGL